MLNIILQVTINIVNKNLVIFIKILQRILKFNVYYWDFSFKIIFVLILILYYYIIKKQNVKQNIIRISSLKNFNIIFVLIIKIIAIYIWIFIIKIEKLNF